MGFGKGKGFSPVVEPPVEPEPGVQSNDCQQQHDTDQGFCQSWNANSQTFTPDHDYDAVGLSLMLSQFSPLTKGPLIVKLTLNDEPWWDPTVLWSQELYSTNLPQTGDYRWTHMVIPSVPLTEGVVYRITIHTLPGWLRFVDGQWESGEPQAGLYFRIQAATNPYPRGSAWRGVDFRDGGLSWTEDAGNDHAFCVLQAGIPPPVGLSEEVEAGSDDCHTYGSTIDKTGNYLYLDYATYDMHLYARFISVPLPKGTTITKAYIDLYASITVVGASSCRILGIKEPNTDTFSTQADADGRPVTDAYVDWAVGSWTAFYWYGRTNDPQDITAIIQEIVNQATWAYDNALAIKIINTARTRTRYAHSFEGGQPPRLYIEYELPD